MGMKIAVTGGMGFIGHEIAKDLIDRGHFVYIVDFWKEILRTYEQTRLPILPEIYDVLSKCEGAIEPWEFIYNDLDGIKFDLVVHAGAVVDTMNIANNDLFDKNVDFTKALVKACEKHSTNIIFMSSAAVYGSDGKPNNPYGLTKSLGEAIMRNAKVSTVSLRLFNVFGKNEHHKGSMASVPWKIANAFKTGAQFELHSLQAQRDFVPSSTVVKVVAHLAEDIYVSNSSWRRVYDVGTGSPTPFLKLAELIPYAMEYAGESPLKLVERPTHLNGRYQEYTCAGTHDAENLGDIMTTEKGLEEAYGVDKQ